MTKELLFQDSAVEYCLKYLKAKKGYKWENIENINRGRYTVVYGNPNIAICLKRAWFEKFGDMGFMNDITGQQERGIGDSLNVEDLKDMVARKVEIIYIVFRDGKIYQISMYDFLNLSHRWVNKESKEVRSISIHLYDRVNKDVPM